MVDGNGKLVAAGVQSGSLVDQSDCKKELTGIDAKNFGDRSDVPNVATIADGASSQHDLEGVVNSGHDVERPWEHRSEGALACDVTLTGDARFVFEGTLSEEVLG